MLLLRVGYCFIVVIVCVCKIRSPIFILVLAVYQVIKKSTCRRYFMAALVQKAIPICGDGWYLRRASIPANNVGHAVVSVVDRHLLGGPPVLVHDPSVGTALGRKVKLSSKWSISEISES